MGTNDTKDKHWAPSEVWIREHFPGPHVGGGIMSGCGVIFPDVREALRDNFTDFRGTITCEECLEVFDHHRRRKKEADSDPVNHPSHYTAYEGLEIIDLTEQMNFNRGNAVKYIARAGLKDPDSEIEDLDKARWYIEREIKRVRKLKEE